MAQSKTEWWLIAIGHTAQKTLEYSFGYKGKKEAENLLEKTATMLAGGDLSEEDKDAFFQSITEIYFDAKSKARKKYGRKNADRIDSQK